MIDNGHIPVAPTPQIGPLLVVCCRTINRLLWLIIEYRLIISWTGLTVRESRIKSPNLTHPKYGSITHYLTLRLSFHWNVSPQSPVKYFWHHRHLFCMLHFSTILAVENENLCYFYDFVNSTFYLSWLWIVCMPCDMYWLRSIGVGGGYYMCCKVNRNPGQKLA